MSFDEMLEKINELGVKIPMEAFIKLNTCYMELLTTNLKVNMAEKYLDNHDDDAPDYLKVYDRWVKLVDLHAKQYCNIMEMFETLGAK